LDPTSQGSKLGDAGWPRAVGFNGGVVGLNGARGGRERRQVGTAWQRHEREKAPLLECTNAKRRRLLAKMPKRLGPARPSVGRWWPTGRSGLARVSLAGWAGSQGRFQMEIDF
jgi:hypothetical protein